MSNVYELPVAAQVYDEASAWIARLDRGLSGEEETRLSEWLAADPQNRKLLLDVATLWDRMDTISRLSEICPRAARRSSPLPWLAVAASLAILTALLFPFVHHGPTDQPAPLSQPEAAGSGERVYETAIGEQSAINLSDGTGLILNTNTLVRVRYTGRHRFLVLERGEIHLEVAPETYRPLSVLAGDQLVQAVGTAFNIEINSNDQVELLVTEGTVRVAIYHAASRGEPGEPDLLPADARVVSAGEKALLGSPDEELETVETEDIEVKLSWREGNLVFRGESLEEAVAEIGRYTAVEFVILDDESKKVRVAGLFKAGDLNGLLAALEENFNVVSQRVSDDKIVLKGR